MGDFKLAASLHGHEDDVSKSFPVLVLLSSQAHVPAQVRVATFPSPGSIVSASRDGTVRVWKSKSSDLSAFHHHIICHESGFMNALATIPPNSQYPEGLVVSGGKETIIDVRPPGAKPDDNAEAILLGHTANVCALDVDPTSTWIISGGWDAQARIWEIGKWESHAMLEGHEGSVWAVLAWAPDLFITGMS